MCCIITVSIETGQTVVDFVAPIACKHTTVAASFQKRWRVSGGLSLINVSFLVFSGLFRSTLYSDDLAVILSWRHTHESLNNQPPKGWQRMGGGKVWVYLPNTRATVADESPILWNISRTCKHVMTPARTHAQTRKVYTHTHTILQTQPLKER